MLKVEIFIMFVHHSVKILIRLLAELSFIFILFFQLNGCLVKSYLIHFCLVGWKYSIINVQPSCVFIDICYSLEKEGSLQNMIDMKSIIPAIVLLFVIGLLALILHDVDHSLIPFNAVLLVTFITGVLVKFAHNQNIKHFFFHKMSQKKTILREKLSGYKTSILKIKVVRVGVSNVVENS